MAMNEAKEKVIHTLKEQKKIYFFVFLFVIIGIVLGIVFSIVISKSDHSLVTESLNQFFQNIKTNHIEYASVFFNSLLGNVFLLLFLWLLGISIVGIPIICFLVAFKSFLFSFSISSIFYTYHLGGIAKVFGYIFPQQLLMMCLLIFVSFYAIYFSKRLFYFLFLKQDISLRHAMKRYVQVLLICLVGGVICSLLEVFFMPVFLRLFY